MRTKTNESSGRLRSQNKCKYALSKQNVLLCHNNIDTVLASVIFTLFFVTQYVISITAGTKPEHFVICS